MDGKVLQSTAGDAEFDVELAGLIYVGSPRRRCGS